MYISYYPKSTKFQKNDNDLILVGDWKELESGNRMKRGEGIDAKLHTQVKGRHLI